MVDHIDHMIQLTFKIELQLSPVVMRNSVRNALPNVLKLVCLFIPEHSPSRLSQALLKFKQNCSALVLKQVTEKSEHLLSLPNISTPRVANIKKNNPNRRARFPTWSKESPTVLSSDCIPLADLRRRKTLATLMIRMTLMSVGSTGNSSMSTNLFIRMEMTDMATMNRSKRFHESLMYCFRPSTYMRSNASSKKIKVNARLKYSSMLIRYLNEVEGFRIK